MCKRAYFIGRGAQSPSVLSATKFLAGHHGQVGHQHQDGHRGQAGHHGRHGHHGRYECHGGRSLKDNILNIAKGTTDPRVELISQDHS